MNEWQNFDEETQLIFPWYTKPFLDVLKTWDVSNWKVFEYGSGSSTLWWRKKAKLVHSIDSNQEWSVKVKSMFVNDKKTFIEYPTIEKYEYDCIIIDGEPVEWRDECTKFALDSIRKGGIIIIDNYNQASVGLHYWPRTSILLRPFKINIFSQEGHDDWKTAYWVIDK